eukprot:g15604.t1
MILRSSNGRSHDENTTSARGGLDPATDVDGGGSAGPDGGQPVSQAEVEELRSEIALLRKDRDAANAARDAGGPVPGRAAGGAMPGGFAPVSAPVGGGHGVASMPPSLAGGGFASAGGMLNHPTAWSGGAPYLNFPGGGTLGSGAVGPLGAFTPGGLSPVAPAPDLFGGLGTPPIIGMGAGVNGISGLHGGSVFGGGGAVASGGIHSAGLHVPAVGGYGPPGVSNVSIPPQFGAAVAGAGGGLAAAAVDDKLMHKTLAERRLKSWNSEPSRKQFCVFGTFPGDLTKEQKSIHVTKHVFETVLHLNNLNPLICGPPEMEANDMSVSALLANLGRLIVTVARNGTSINTTVAQEATARIANFEHQWKRGVDMVAEHEARHFKASRSPRPRARMVAKLREDLDNFSVNASHLARTAGNRYTLPPPSIANFQPIAPVWSTFHGWVTSGGLDNGVEYESAAKSSGGSGGSKRAANSNLCRYSAEDCPFESCRFNHGAPRGKRKASGSATPGSAKRQSTQAGRRAGGAVGGSAAPATAAAAAVKKKGKATNQQTDAEDEDANDE